MLVGCRQSLFDAHGEVAGTGADAQVTERCPAPCLGDSGGDFDGSPNGLTGRWRYVEDRRNRTWEPMTAVDGGFVGADPANTIRRCAPNSNAEACQALPGALLLSTSGTAAPADPAIEFTAETNQTIELQLGVHIPAGGFAQTIRIYRNSREDVLLTDTAGSGTTLRHAITLDALAGDRFLVAVEPPALGQPDIAVQLHVVGANATFPTTCQLAIAFSTLSGLTTENVCNSDNALTAKYDSATGTPAPALTNGPFPELGKAANIAEHNFYSGTQVLTRPGDVTVDLWVKHTALVDPDTNAWLYSDLNADRGKGGGIGMLIYSFQSKLRLRTETVYTSVGVVPVYVDIDFPLDQQWHFVRAVHKIDGPINVCLDGAFKGMVMASGSLRPFSVPFVGQNAVLPENSAAFIGAIDDLRVFNTALPCD